MMHTQTHSFSNRWLSLLTAVLALLLLFIMTGASASAQALPTTADSAHTSISLTVDRTDDTAEAQVCTDAPNDCSLRGDMTMVNRTVSGNTAGSAGGGISVTEEGQGTLTHVTIAQNFGGTAGGLFSQNPAFRISNTLLANNLFFPGLFDVCTGSVTSLGYNLLERSSCTLLGAASGDIVGQAEGDVDAKLGQLHNSGFAVETHALLPGSPAINRGSPDGCLAVDQQGVARPQGGRCDIGAFEAPFYYLPLVTR